MKQFATSILLALTLPIGQAHLFFSNTVVQNWIIKEYRPMVLSWNVTFVGFQANIIMYFLAWILYKKNRVNDTTVVSFFVLSILDTFFYFYNYKLHGMWVIYACFVIVWAIIFNKYYLISIGGRLINRIKRWFKK